MPTIEIKAMETVPGRDAASIRAVYRQAYDRRQFANMELEQAERHLLGVKTISPLKEGHGLQGIISVLRRKRAGLNIARGALLTARLNLEVSTVRLGEVEEQSAHDYVAHEAAIRQEANIENKSRTSSAGINPGI